jgi:Type IV secretion-system coupling protein DNA-binding domain
MRRHPLEPRRPVAPALASGALIGLCIGALAVYQLFVLHAVAGWWAERDGGFSADLAWLTQAAKDAARTTAPRDLLGLLSWPERIAGALERWFGGFDLWPRLVLRAGTVAAAALCAGALGGVSVYRVSEPRDRARHLEGQRRLWTGRGALRELRRLLRPELKASGSRLRIAPGLRWPIQRELQHTGLFGMTGSGKTMILRGIIEQLLARQERMILLDAKGDMTSGLPGEFLLLAPQDERSYIWQLGRDIRSEADARELAARVVPESHDPLWSTGGRQLLVGVAMSLMKDCGTDWSWDDLLARIVEEPVFLKDRLELAHPPAAAMLALHEDGQPTRTTHSLWLTLTVAAQDTLSPLAQAWGRHAEGPRMGLREWIDGTDDLPRTMVLQRSAALATLSEAWMGLAIALMAARVVDPRYAPSDTPQITWCIDECPVLGKVKELETLLAVGRSQGQSVTLAAQDLEQLAQLYGEPGTKAILNNLGTKIIARQPSGPSAERVVRELVGKRRVTWRSVSVGEARGFERRPRNTHFEHAEIDLVSPRFVEAELGLKHRFGRPVIRAMLLGLGDAFLLRWPIRAWPKRRPAHVPAQWLQEGGAARSA